MRIGNYQFKPRLVPSLLVLLLLPLLIRLGFWQLARADEKRQIIATQNAKLAMPPMLINNKMTKTQHLEFRRLQVQGSFLTKYQIFIDNKVHDEQTGYDVVTPLRINNSDQYVLVNRGWVPSTGSRAVLPTVDTPAQEVNLIGIARYHTKDVMSFGVANRSNQGWPAVVRWVDIKALRAQTKLNLLPFMLLLDPKSQYGFVRKWEFVNMPPEKHISYAVQWFTMAAVLLIIYLVVNLKRINKTEIRDD
jgi:surfeit locus 1 family protein